MGADPDDDYDDQLQVNLADRGVYQHLKRVEASSIFGNKVSENSPMKGLMKGLQYFARGR